MKEEEKKGNKRTENVELERRCGGVVQNEMRRKHKAERNKEKENKQEGEGLSQRRALEVKEQHVWLEVDNYLITTVSSTAIATTENTKVMPCVLFLAMWGFEWPEEEPTYNYINSRLHVMGFKGCM